MAVEVYFDAYFVVVLAVLSRKMEVLVDCGSVV